MILGRGRQPSGIAGVSVSARICALGVCCAPKERAQSAAEETERHNIVNCLSSGGFPHKRALCGKPYRRLTVSWHQ